MFAYLDPGTGSMLVGAFAAGAAGIGVAARSTISRFKKKGKSKADDAPLDQQEPETSSPA